MTARMLALDLRRGPAPLVALAVLLLGGAAAGSGCESAVLSLRQGLWVVFPCVLAAGIWHGGAARRRGVEETIRAAPAPAWRRAAVEGAAVGGAAAAALVLLLAATALTGCALGSAAATAVAVLALVAAAFAGLALGRVAAAPIAAPLTLFVVLAVTATLGSWAPGDGPAMLLLPGVADGVAPDQLSSRVAAAQALWFGGVALSGWLLASARLPLAALAPAAAGLAGLLVLS